MAGALVGGGRARRGRGLRRRGRMAEINVTPFVDVMLVLLIVFMITAPLLTVSIPVQLPETQARQSESEADPLSVSVTADGTIYLQETAVTMEELVPRMRAISNEGYDRHIFIRGDRNVSWDVMARVMAAISAGGFRRLQLVTDTEEGTGARSGSGRR
jgi:biopolymer transport protein TolR